MLFVCNELTKDNTPSCCIRAEGNYRWSTRDSKSMNIDRNGFFSICKIHKLRNIRCPSIERFFFTTPIRPIARNKSNVFIFFKPLLTKCEMRNNCREIFWFFLFSHNNQILDELINKKINSFYFKEFFHNFNIVSPQQIFIKIQ